jgi:hypothetical protein
LAADFLAAGLRAEVFRLAVDLRAVLLAAAMPPPSFPSLVRTPCA